MIKAGFIGYIGGPNFWEDAQKLADIGFKCADTNGAWLPGEGTGKEKVAKLRAMGIEPLTTAINFPARGEDPKPAALADLDRVIRDCHEQEITRCTIWHSSSARSFWDGFNTSYDEMMRDIEAMCAIAPKLKAEGINLTYHNHYQEFTVYHKGTATIDWLMLCCPELMLDLDCGWATVAGRNPVEELRRFEGRIGGIHLKDIYDFEACKNMGEIHATENATGFTALSSGLLDYEGCIVEADRQGLDNVVIEQDKLHHLNAIDSLHLAYLAMKETGHVI